jgi:cell division protease FtsH
MFVLQFQETPQPEELTINQLAADIKSGEVARVEVEDDDRLFVVYNDGTERETLKESQSDLIEQLLYLGVESDKLSPEIIQLNVNSPSPWIRVFNILAWFLPVVVLGIVFWFVFRQAQGSNNAAISFGKSRARMFTGDHPTITFEDVAGVEEAKEDLKEIVEFLQEPEKFITLGARIPKGVLLVGQPGTGKTLMAKAVSGEAGVPFFSISGSEFVEMFVGVGASRVRDLFDQAKKHSPCIVFVDEIDAVGRQRGAGLGGSHDEREQTLNQILVEMDGFDTDTNVIIIAATNRPDILDPALLRPGRFDRRVVLDRPDVRGREAILKVHTRGKPIDPEVDLGVLARATPGFVGADLENLVNEAAILAARRNKKAITQPELQEAIERIVAGPERKSKLISQEEKLITAYHEAGHAVVAHVLPNADPVLKVTIVPRGMALGYMWNVPEEDREMTSRSKLVDDMATALGGRAAEELTFDDITSGASSDLQRVTEIARMMIMRLGMSEKLGTAEEIDKEVLSLVNNAYKKAKDTLSKYRVKLDEIAQKLIEVETLTQEEFEKIFPSPGEKRIGGTPALVN